MIGGDEVSSIVIDAGSSSVRAGFAGEDCPKFVVPSCVGVTYSTGDSNVVGNSTKAIGEGAQDANGKGSVPVYHVGTNAVTFRRDEMEIKKAVTEGTVSDWDAIEQLWEHTFTSQLRVDPSHHPVLVTEAAYNSKQVREKMCEILFEKFKIPAYFTSKTPVLTAFASAKATGLIVDCGASMATVTPIHDGYALQKQIVKSATLGGDNIDALLVDTLAKKDITIQPRYLFTKKEVRPAEFQVTKLDFPKTHKTYHDFMVQEVVSDLKHSTCKLWDKPLIAGESPAFTSVSYELPDGKTIELGAERFAAAETMFNPSYNQLTAKSSDDCIDGLPKMIADCLAKCDQDIRRDLCANVIVTGAGSLFPGFVERLSADLPPLIPNLLKLKVIAPSSSSERRFGSWIGGSILASLGTFQQMWISNTEYQEHGAGLIERKCP